MFRNEDMLARQNEMNATFIGNNNTIENEMNMNVGAPMMEGNAMEFGGGCCQRPITGPVQQRCIHKTIVHEVPHVCPIHTRVINHHVYKHTYRPAYSCSQENTCTNVQCGSCCQFR